jgi:hypothetical protein
MTRTEKLNAEVGRCINTAMNLALGGSTMLAVVGTPGLLCKHDEAVRGAMAPDDLAAYLMRILTRQWTWGGQDGGGCVIRCPFCGDGLAP